MWPCVRLCVGLVSSWYGWKGSSVRGAAVGFSRKEWRSLRGRVSPGRVSRETLRLSSENRTTKVDEPKPNDAHGAGATRAVGSPCAAAARGVGLSVPATTTSPLRPLWVKNASTEF